MSPQIVCVGCGCTDDDACPDGCSWLRADQDAGEGVCSNCPEHVEAFDAGGYVDVDAAERELILPGDPEFHL
jgi:hypothetical protein